MSETHFGNKLAIVIGAVIILALGLAIGYAWSDPRQGGGMPGMEKGSMMSRMADMDVGSHSSHMKEVMGGAETHMSEMQGHMKEMQAHASNLHE